MRLSPDLRLRGCSSQALRYPQNQRRGIRVIVRGDDFGYTHASNEALPRAFAAGFMTSASLLVPAPWFA